MSLQFIHDNKGNTTGIFIPIEELKKLKSKYADLQKAEAENLFTLSEWQKKIIDERLNDNYSNPSDVSDFDDPIDSIEKDL